MSDTKKYDVVVIGAGPGGYAAAFRAADLGKKVIMIEKDQKLGGVCLNSGCIPSKALLHLAKVMEDAKSLKSSGVSFSDPQLDLEGIRNWKNSVVSKLNKGISQLANVRNVEIIYGTAEFITKNELSISNEGKKQTVEFIDCIIATGSRASSIPDLKIDHQKIINSTSALQLPNIPDNMLIIGGGYIGLEMGSVYHALGSEITVVEFMSTILPGADADLVKPLYRKLKRTFKNIYLNSRVTATTKNDDSVQVNFKSEDGKEFSENYDAVLISVGRKPNTDNLGLSNIGISLTGSGYISVNEKRQTSISNIYAIGDITGEPMLAHKASHEGKIAAEVIAGHKAAFEPAVIPAVIFTDPEIAWAGPTEAELTKRGIAYEKGEFPWAASGRALTIKHIEGKTKLLFDPVSKKIISAGIVGPNAGDLIGEAILAIEMGADADDIGLSIHPHPTLTETVGNAAEMFSGTITDLYVPKEK